MEGYIDCMNENGEMVIDHVNRYFVEKEQLVSNCESELKWLAGEWKEAKLAQDGFETTLWTLRVEMVHLMQCDVRLWKQLTELYASVSALKAGIRNGTLYRTKSSTTVSSASSDTDSFVSAEECSEVCYSDIAEDRVLSWINQCDQGETVKEDSTEIQQTVSEIPRSRTYNGIFSQNREIQSLVHILPKTNIIAQLPSNSGIDVRSNGFNYLQDVLGADILDLRLTTKLRNAYNMKSLEEMEILSETNFSYYKSSLRLLGSVRMRSRIFEPSLTKWRPFALSQSSDNYTIVPPTAFSNIQPRPRLHINRLFSALDNKLVKQDDEKCLQNVTNGVKEVENEFKIENEIQKENAEEVGKIKTPLSDEKRDALQRYRLNYSGYTGGPSGKTEDQLKFTISVRERRENAEGVGKTEMPLAEECSEQDFRPFYVGSKYQSGGNVESDNSTESASENESDLYSLNFLDVKDGLITCRIMSPELQKELNQGIVEDDDFEYLMLVDGRVTFTPYTRDNDREESYFLGWLFEKEFENEDSFFIHLLFDETDIEETNTESGHTEESYFIHQLFHEPDTQCLITVTNDTSDESFYICHLFEDFQKETETVHDEFWDSYNIIELFQEPDTANEINSDVYTQLTSHSASSLDSADDMTVFFGNTSTDVVYASFELSDTSDSEQLEYEVDEIFGSWDIYSKWLGNDNLSTASSKECINIESSIE